MMVGWTLQVSTEQAVTCILVTYIFNTTQFEGWLDNLFPTCRWKASLSPLHFSTWWVGWVAGGGSFQVFRGGLEFQECWYTVKVWGIGFVCTSISTAWIDICNACSICAICLHIFNYVLDSQRFSFSQCIYYFVLERAKITPLGRWAFFKHIFLS